MPARPTFQTLLTVRQRREEAQERALAAINSHYKQLQLKLGKVEEEIGRCNRDRGNDIGKLHTAAILTANSAHQLALRNARTHLLEQLGRLEKDRKCQEDMYRTARSDREMISELEEQRRTDLRMQEVKREQRVLDDLFSSRNARLRSSR